MSDHDLHDRLSPAASEAMAAARRKLAGAKPARLQDVEPLPIEAAGEPEGFHGSGVGGFFLEIEGRRLGPFKTADDAARWAIDNLSAGADWLIRPFLDPESEL